MFLDMHLEYNGMKNISHKTATTGNWYAFSLPFYPAIFCPPQLYFSFTTDVAYLNLGIQIIYVKYVTILPVCIQSTCFIFGKIAHILQFILNKYIISHNISMEFTNYHELNSILFCILFGKIVHCTIMYYPNKKGE